jgi:hypothetical protein
MFEVFVLPVYQVPEIHSPEVSVTEDVDTVIAVGIALVFTVSENGAKPVAE